VLVATPERFDAWLRYNRSDDVLKLVVFDEAHSIANSTRGARLEGLITRLRLRQTQEGGFRMVALSAVLADAHAFLDFLGVDSANYFVDSWRPTARHLAIWSTSGELVWIFGNDSLRPTQLGQLSILGAHKVQWPHPIMAPPSWQRPEAQPKREVTVASQDNVAYLAEYLLGVIGGPILVICMTRETTRLIANAISLRLQDDPAKALSRANLAQQAATLAPWYPGLPAMILKGVAFHNASVPTELRKHIEEAVNRRELDFIVSTTTLAEGADLPFRVTLVESWIVGFGADARPLDPLMFRNIAGRCGRAGMFTEGDTVLYENVLGPAHLTSQMPARRTAIASMIGNPPTLQSALPIDGLKHDLNARYAAISAQVIAAIPENPDDETLAQRLAQFSYARKVLSAAQVDQLFATIVGDLLSESDGEPLARAASPIRLTELGAAVNRTGLSTITARTLLRFLRREAMPVGPYELIVDTILEFATAPEQTDSYLQKVVTSRTHKGFATVQDLAGITTGWLEQRDSFTIFQSLPRYVNSKAKDDYKQRQFDKFVQTLESVYGNFLPWVMRAAGQLAPFGAEWSREIRWMELAENLERRVVPETFEQGEETLDLA
jgi:helicase